eukprot:g4389.t1
MPFAATRDPRFIQGRALVKAKKYEAAIDCFCDLLEALVATFGDQHVETTPVLFEYGSVLLLKAESSANLFGDSIEEAEQEKQGKATGPSADAPALSSSSSSSSSGEPMSGMEKAKRAADAANAAAADLEIAWEVLEVSRVILARHLDTPALATEARVLLARVHLRLGDHELDNGQLDAAIRDYKACLELRSGVLEPTDRRLADAHTSLAIAHLYNSMPRENAQPIDQVRERSAAAEHYDVAGDILERLLLKQTRASAATSALSQRIVAAYEAEAKALSQATKAEASKTKGAAAATEGKGKNASRGVWYKAFTVPSKTDTSVAKEDQSTWELVDTLQILREKSSETLKMAKGAGTGQQQPQAAKSSSSSSSTSTTAPAPGAPSSSEAVPGPSGGVTTVGFGPPSGMFGNSGFDAPVLGGSSSSSALNPLPANTLQPKKKKRKVMLTSTTALPKEGPSPGIGETAAP